MGRVFQHTGEAARQYVELNSTVFQMCEVLKFVLEPNNVNVYSIFGLVFKNNQPTGAAATYTVVVAAAAQDTGFGQVFEPVS